MKRLKSWQLHLSYLWSCWMFRLTHDKKTCTAAVCSICDRYLA